MSYQVAIAEPTPQSTAERLGWPRFFSAIFDFGVPTLATAFFLIFGVVFLREGRESEWIECYVKAARRLQQAEVIHRVEPVAYAYPPAMAMLAVPLANLPDDWSIAAWYAVNVLATCAAFTGAWRLAGGPPLTGFSWRWHGVFWIGVFLTLRFLVAPLENHQTDMVIAALVIAGGCACWRGNDVGAAAWWGVAAAMKCTPLLFGGYLLWRGRWRGAITLGAIALALNLLPDLLWPQASGSSYLMDWSRTFLARVGKDAPGAWFSDILLNQSLAGLVNRWATLGIPGSAAALADRYQIAPSWPPLLMRGLVYGTGLTLLGYSVSKWGSFARQPAAVQRFEPRPLPWNRLQVGLDVAMITCLMLLLSPMSSKAHYAVLMLPSLFVARRMMERPTRGWWLQFALLSLAGPLTAKGLLGKSLGDLTLAWGLPTFYALLALLAMWRLRTECAARVAEGLPVLSLPKVPLPPARPRAA